MVETTEKIPQHRHCAGCGKAFVCEVRFYSKSYQEESGKEVKGKLRKLMLIWLGIVAVTIVLVVLTL